MVIQTKTDFLRLWKSGLLGNRQRDWETYGDLVASGYRGLVSIRGRITNMRSMHYGVPFDEVRDRINQIVQSIPCNERDLYLVEGPPDDRLTIQGEFCNSESSYGMVAINHLTYSTLKTSMRKALADGAIHVDGIAALAILRSYLDGASMDSFQELRENYPNAAIEFSCYEMPLGDRQQNTIIWEVRSY